MPPRSFLSHLHIIYFKPSFTPSSPTPSFHCQLLPHRKIEKPSRRYCLNLAHYQQICVNIIFTAGLKNWEAVLPITISMAFFKWLVFIKFFQNASLNLRQTKTFLHMYSIVLPNIQLNCVNLVTSTTDTKRFGNKHNRILVKHTNYRSAQVYKDVAY